MTPTCPVCGQAQATLQAQCSTCGASLDPSLNDPLLGREVGHFRLDALIGRGGMGSIYRATHKVLGTHYAIKLLHPQLASDPTVLERFRREAIAASQLKHNNIVFIADYGWSAGIGAYIVMEFLEGRSLGQALRDGRRYTPSELLALFRQICRGLYAAHKQGTVHRDLKPDNIFLSELEDEDQDQVKILDFGIARIAEEGGYQSVTLSEIAIGTPHYMSPEQARAQWDEVDTRTDIYALGVILYKVLTGKTPFPRTSTHEVLTLKGMGEMTPLDTYRPDLTGTRLADLVAQLLAFHKEDRPADAKQVLKSMEEALQDLPDTPITMSSQKPSPRATRQPGTGPSGEAPLPSAEISRPNAAGHVGLREGSDPPSFPSGPSFVPVSKPSIPAPHHAQSVRANASNFDQVIQDESMPSVTFDGKSYPVTWIAAGIGGLLLVCGLALFWPSATKQKPAGLVANADAGALPPLDPSAGRLPGIPRLIPLPPRSISAPKAAVPDIVAPTPDKAEASSPDLPKARLQKRPAPPVIQDYELKILSRPSAMIYVRGRKPCRTPCTIRGNQGVSLLIYLRKRGYKTRTYRWRPTKNKSIRLRMQKRSRGKKSGMFEKVPI